MRLLLRFITVLSLMAIAIIPLCFALAQSEANPERTLPYKVNPGDTFNVTVNFTSPDDNFSSLVLTDHAPQGWDVKVRGKWCSPKPKWVLSTNDATDNMIEVYWNTGTYPQGENFTVRYRVNVSVNASPGNYDFSGDLYYHCDLEPPLESEEETIDGDDTVKIPGGGGDGVDGGGGGGGVTVVAGDVNEDGRVDRDDVVMVMKVILGIPGFEEFTPGADCNEDGKVNALDITAIKIIILELD